MARATAAFRVKLNRLLDRSSLGEIQQQVSGVFFHVFIVELFLRVVAWATRATY